MGNKKNMKRRILQKQIIVYYIHVLAFTMITSMILIFITYYIYHSVVGFHSLDLKSTNVIKIIEYSSENSNQIIEGKLKEELHQITDENGLDYYVKNTENQILYGNSVIYINTNKKNFLISLFHEILSNSMITSTMDIPLVDHNTGKVSQILVLTENETNYMALFVLVDIFIPIICLIVYTLIFSKSLSRDIKKPLDELMEAVENIKAQNLEFSIDNNYNNEIGDLIKAFEEMRINLKESLKREWQLEQDRREMVTAITHDLRTPLAIIQGHVEGLKDGLYQNKDKLILYLDIIEQNSLRIKRLIDDMNSLSEIDSFDLRCREEDILKFLKDKMAEMKILADNEKIHIVTDITDCRTKNSLIVIDSDRLSQVINNIMNNSMRFTPHEGSIQFQAKIEDKRAYFKIWDTGQGFSEKDLNNLFKKFYKGDASRSKEKGHFGLGLYIAKLIVEKHQGSIKAYNLQDGAACIEFYISYVNEHNFID